MLIARTLGIPLEALYCPILKDPIEHWNKMQCWHILVVNNLWWKLVWKKNPSIKWPKSKWWCSTGSFSLWKKPRRSQQTHKYVLFQRSHNVSYLMNINAFIYVILLTGQKSICSTILTVTYSNWYQSNIHYLQVYSMLKKSSQKRVYH